MRDTIEGRLVAAVPDLADALTGAFAGVPTPPAFAWAFPGGTDAPPPEPAADLDLDLDDPGERVAILAGPSALPHREALHALAAHLSAPVANTWGAKGIFPWDSPHHMGTCGLQADDFALLGLAGYDRLLAVGIDPLESPAERYALTRTVEVPGAALDRIRESTPARVHPIAPNDLYGRLARVAQPGYVDERSPRHPARAVMDLKQSMPPGAVLTAQPGPVGLWVARTFPTDGPGTVFVPAVNVPGIAAALALVAACAGRAAVAVTAAPVDPVTAGLADRAAAAGVPFRLEVWADDVDLSLTALLVEAAGPVVAWT